ncbi:hypothetical protein GOODEAATRI_032375, partial [Goodea atripinnis]
DSFEQYNSIKDFLHADVNLNFHPTYINNPEELFKVTYDIDGLVIELSLLTGLISDLHYLLFPVITEHMLKGCYHWIKKHVDITQCSGNGLKALQNAVGYTLGYVDGGFHLTLMLLPACLVDPDTRLLNPVLYKINACEVFNQIRLNFQSELRNASDKNKCRPTLQKQVSSETSIYNVLPQDSLYIFSLVDKAIGDVIQCPFLKPAIFLTRFGQKHEDSMDLTDIVNPCEVASVSVHVAAKLTAHDPEIHTLFSRYGLEQLVGSRGSLYSVLGMHEAANYHTDLKHSALNVSSALKEVFTKEGQVTFLQMYVDSPHVHLNMPFKHPVSGAVVTCRLSHHQFQKALLSRAIRYIKHMEDLKDKLVSQLGLRIEQVIRFEEEFPRFLNPCEHFNEPALMSLLRDNAVVIPFKDLVCQHSLLPTLKQVLDHLLKELDQIFTTSEGVARYDSCWKAFQCELALEEMFFGHPLSPVDERFSVSLGTNTVHPKSLTHTRGFIGLAPHSAASAGEVPPPLDHWTRNQFQKERIQRIFPLCQTLEASPAITGFALLKLLLCDIYRRNTDIPWPALTSDVPPGRLAGAQKVEDLCEDLSKKKSFPAPLTFGRACAMLVQAGRDVKECLVQGFMSEKLRFFPAIKFRDLKGGYKIFWNCKDYVALEAEGTSTVLSRVASANLQVFTEIERRSLCYSRTLEKYRDHGIPWMEKVLQRLPPNMKGAIHLSVITFVSCIGLMMNGDFVVFEHIRTLLSQISPHVSQAHLQKWQILSKFTLPKVFNCVIFKLHEEIPYRLRDTMKVASFLKPKENQPDEEQPFEDVQAIDDQDDIHPLMRSKAMTMPENCKVNWTKEEEDVIDKDPKVKDKDAYKLYVQKCRERQIPIRTFKGFRTKRWRY